MDEQARGLLEVAGSLLGELDLEVVIDRLLESARELTKARYAALGVLNSSKTELERFITVGISEDARAEIGTLPRGRGVLGELILNPVPLRLAEVGDHPHSYGFPLGHPPLRSFLGVSILAGGVPFGSLYLTETAGRAEFSSADEESAEIARAVSGAPDLQVILELVAKRGRALVSARALLIELVDGSELVVAAAAGRR